MTLVSDIITRAYRESNLIAIGETPSAAQNAEALDILNTIIAGVYGNEAGDRLDLWPIPTNSNVFTTGLYGPNNPPPNMRLACTLTSATTLYFTCVPADGMRMAVIDLGDNFATNNLVLNGNGFLIEDSTSITMSTNSEKREWIFREDLGGWQKVLPLTTFDTFPFPTDFDDFFVTFLGARLNPRYEKSTAPETVEALRRGRTQFTARYRQKTQTPAELALAQIYPSRYPSQWTYPQYYFNKGVIPWY